MERSLMHVTKSGLLMGLLAIASPAFADDSSQAMLAFGLAGAWSVDCSTDMTLPCVDIDRCFPRLIFTVPLQGNPLQQVISPTAAAGQVFSSMVTINSAARLGDDGIRITTTSAVELSGPASSTQQTLGETWETVYRKQGTSLRVWSARETNGTKIGARDGYRWGPASDWKPENGAVKQWRQTDQETPGLAKCPN
jgi:hypothetical protein